MNKKSPYLTDEQRKAATEEIINFFATQRDESIGLIAAEDLLECFLEVAGKEIYNQGVNDTKKFFQQRTEELMIDIDVSIKK